MLNLDTHTVDEAEYQTQLPVSDRISGLCLTLVKRVVDGKPGIKQEDLDWLESTRCDYKNLRNLKSGNQLSKSKLTNLESKGLLNKDENEIFVTFELLDALSATCNYIQVTEPVNIRDQVLQPDEKFPDLAAKANIEFFDFFIKIHQKFNLPDKEILNVYHKIFNLSGLDNELRIKALESFPGGVLAAVRSYLFLSKELPGWNFRLPTIEMDLKNAVDLIATSPAGEERFFEIKGNRAQKNIGCYEITDQKQMEQKRKLIIMTSDRNSAKKLTSLYKLYEFVQGKIKTGENARGFFVEAPSV